MRCELKNSREDQAETISYLDKPDHGSWLN
jgi:hypothetical protein